jgi:hypothetical protein
MPNATVRATARNLRRKPTDRRIGKRKAARAPRERPVDDHPIARLSFVKTLDRLHKSPSGRSSGRCFWNVRPTGDYVADCITGETLALEYLAFEEARTDVGTILAWIVGDMPPKQTGVEVGFLIAVAYAASAGAQRARDIAAYWKSCQKEARS